MVTAAALRAAVPLAVEAVKREQAAATVAPQCPDDPVGWMETRLRAYLWSTQREIAVAVATHRRVAVHSCWASGKSWLAARLVAWWLDTHAAGEAFVVTTATTGAQVRAILWREIGRAHRDGKLAGRLNQTEWWLNDEMVAFGRKPADYDPNAFQGIHARYVLVVIDEAAGVPEAIFRSAAGLTSNEHSRILAIGNPDDPQSYFAGVCQPASGWHVIPIDAFQTPNFTDEGADVPAAIREQLISPTYEQELRAEVGEESPVYIAKVRGQFPEDASDGVVPLSWVRQCQQLDAEWTPAQLLPVELGMDVGAGGDATTLRERRGAVAGRAWSKRTPDWADAVAMALQAIEETGATAIKVDTIGIGWGTVGRLRELKAEGRHRAEVIAVNVGEAPSDVTKFHKLRDQLWWEVGRELTRAHAWDLRAVDEGTVAQLIAPTYQRDSANKIKVEPKAETRKRLKRSPDDADGLLLAYYVPPDARTAPCY